MLPWLGHLSFDVLGDLKIGSRERVSRSMKVFSSRVKVKASSRRSASLSPGSRLRPSRVVRRSPYGTRWGFHLCVGDMNNKAFSRLEDTTTLVLLADALVSGFPAGRTLEFLHLPLAHGSEPPTRDEAFYAPLAGLSVPPDARLVAGFAHEAQSLEEQLELRDIVEAQVKRPLDIAASCGLGRRDLVAAESNLRLSRDLVV